MIIGSLVGLAWQGNTFFGLQDEIAAKNEYIDDITNCEYTTIGYDLNDDMKNAVDFITFESDGKNYRVDVHGQVTFSSEKKYIATDEWIISYEDGLKSEGDPVVVEVAFEAKYFMFNHILNNEWTKDVVITPEYIMLSNGERCIYIFRVENVYMFYSELNAGVPITYNPPMKTIKQNYLLTFSMDGEEVYNVNDYSDPKGKYLYTKKYQQDVRLSLTATESGNYEMCLKNNDRADAKIRFEFLSGIAAMDASEIAKESSIQPAEAAIVRLKDMSKDLINDLSSVVKEEDKNLKANDAISSKITMVSIITLGVMIAVGVVETMYIQKYLQNRKLI